MYAGRIQGCYKLNICSSGRRALSLDSSILGFHRPPWFRLAEVVRVWMNVLSFAVGRGSLEIMDSSASSPEGQHGVALNLRSA